MEVIQSLSICCPARKCINHCKTCTARQHDNPYENKYNGNHMDTFEYWNDVIKRMKYAQSKGCTTVMLTGSNEPQQDRRWLEGLSLAMKSLSEPFVNIEIQTTGAFIDLDYMKFLKAIGVTTIAISTFNIFNEEKNRKVEETADKDLNIVRLCNDAHSIGLNIRMCINVTDIVFRDDFCKCEVWQFEGYDSDEIKSNPRKNEILAKETREILKKCELLHANQVTFRKMWSNPGTKEAEWIEDHCTFSNELLRVVNEIVTKEGTLINRLPYGAARYDYLGFSIVIDIDSMAKDETNTATKYYIIRENGKMYSSWDSPASIVF